MTDIRSQRGFTVIELIVALGVSALVFTGLVNMYSTITGISHDHHIRIDTLAQSQAVMQTIGGELRVLGNGVPFDQDGFNIGDLNLSDPTVADPIEIATATTSLISFRLNETGEVNLLTADFDPAATLTISLTNVSSYAENDPIYISNSVVGESDGLYGIVDSVDVGAGTVTLQAGPVYTPDATFEMGSIFEEVPLITYTTVGGSITRDSGFGQVSLCDNCSLTLEYLTEDGTTITPPLTNLLVTDSLRAIRVTITAQSDKNLKNGTPFTATNSQVFALRNLNYLF